MLRREASTYTNAPSAPGQLALSYCRKEVKRTRDQLRSKGSKDKPGSGEFLRSHRARIGVLQRQDARTKGLTLIENEDYNGGGTQYALRFHATLAIARDPPILVDGTLRIFRTVSFFALGNIL
jgi:hypothetical protein